MVLRAVLAVTILGVAAGTYAELGAGSMPWMSTAATDRLTDAEQAQRAAAFSALPPLRLKEVDGIQARAAVDGMGLPSASRETPLRLAWITLWDTDVQDGDVVRIDSGGYSRTVTLTKRGETFAVPIPASGLITVSGIKDGDGGGITVGLASGADKAVFPIMSVGQSLGLRVTLE